MPTNGYRADYLVLDEASRWDADQDPVGGLWEFIRTNVSGSGRLTMEVIDNAIEDGYPEIHSKQFEAGLAETMRGVIEE